MSSVYTDSKPTICRVTILILLKEKAILLTCSRHVFSPLDQLSRAATYKSMFRARSERGWPTDLRGSRLTARYRRGCTSVTAATRQRAAMCPICFLEQHLKTCGMLSKSVVSVKSCSANAATLTGLRTKTALADAASVIEKACASGEQRNRVIPSTHSARAAPPAPQSASASRPPSSVAPQGSGKLNSRARSNRGPAPP